MDELFIIISSNKRRPVPKKFKEKLMRRFRGSKIKPIKAKNYWYENFVRGTQQQNFHNIY